MSRARIVRAYDLALRYRGSVQLPGNAFTRPRAPLLALPDRIGYFGTENRQRPDRFHKHERGSRRIRRVWFIRTRVSTYNSGLVNKPFDDYTGTPIDGLASVPRQNRNDSIPSITRVRRANAVFRLKTVSLFSFMTPYALFFILYTHFTVSIYTYSYIYPTRHYS